MTDSEMTPEQIRVRCAEIDGWTEMETGKFSGALVGTSPQGEVCTYIPFYTNSIDVINAAVLRLPPDAQKRWAFKLIEILEPVTPEPELGKAGAILLMITASALDRARAFVAIHES